ncbi:pyrrolysine--tRNA(Pyl) ligase large subunit [Desulfobacula sp.]|uniref:pyrrolysine--tRNA(Pyl) ligase large subunit n=1 Tax=Desulfobacula sp. TaxID=2593537 RepID=UPI0025C5EDA5|nr:pyrrolysine--tRNA(Pyl) ligase large subunit [Desulfobacula sp.]MBC2703302.1 pyrrolysine--tRNA(Pyl) ligase large subunit [Desulfobacula sp.]
MNDLTWTDTQIRRLKELGVDLENLPACFSTLAERNKIFQKIEKKQVKAGREKLSDFLIQGGKSHIEKLKETLCRILHQQGFIQVFTPTIITKAALAKMTIDEDHPLFHQVYWLTEKQCLRPMLAPNLYSLMVDFSRLNHRPIRFFEMGSCFRKESDGARHNHEFTMLNFVEMGLAKETRIDRLKELAAIIAKAAGLNEFRFESEDSTVYGTTLDVVAGPENIEVASGAMGPHPLDAAWGITDTWTGMGFGIERLLMISQGDTSIGKWGKSLSYLDGIRLSI